MATNIFASKDKSGDVRSSVRGLADGFLIERVFSILFDLRVSRPASGGGWMAASETASLALGLVLLVGWAGAAMWLPAVLIGLIFLTAGIALLALRSTVRRAAR
jgi:uncharacterized membrane protein HdeD (DUF308 family)